MSKIFLSYSRSSADVAKTLTDDLAKLGHSVWFDANLSGGQVWWNEILARIRDCDLLVLIVDERMLDSPACEREYTYGGALGKPLVPLLASSTVSVNLLPGALARLQLVDYSRQDRDSVIRLARALSSIPPPPPLPDPLPSPPDIPLSYLGGIAQEIDAPGSLSAERQKTLLVDLGRRLRNPGEERDARQLLKRLQERDDCFRSTSNDVDELLKSGSSQPLVEVIPQPPKIGDKAIDEPSDTGHVTPPPVRKRSTMTRWVLAVLALAVLGIFLLYVNSAMRPDEAPAAATATEAPAEAVPAN